MQLALALAAPIIDIFPIAEAKRQAAGIPQHLLANQLGIGQSHYANILRGHDPASAWVRNRLREFVADRLVA